jgi:hypothetical protein
MAEKYIFGYFRTIEAAQKAAEELKNHGFNDVHIDRFSPMLGGNYHDFDDDFENPFTNQAISLTTSTLGSPNRNNDQNILAAAHPDASAMAGGTGFNSPEDVCVTVFTEPKRFDEAYALLEKAGAKL